MSKTKLIFEGHLCKPRGYFPVGMEFPLNCLNKINLSFCHCKKFLGDGKFLLIFQFPSPKCLSSLFQFLKVFHCLRFLHKPFNFLPSVMDWHLEGLFLIEALCRTNRDRNIEQTNEWRREPMDGRLDLWTNGRADGWMDTPEDAGKFLVNWAIVISDWIEDTFLVLNIEENTNPQALFACEAWNSHYSCLNKIKFSFCSLLKKVPLWIHFLCNYPISLGKSQFFSFLLNFLRCFNDFSFSDTNRPISFLKVRKAVVWFVSLLTINNEKRH